MSHVQVIVLAFVAALLVSDGLGGGFHPLASAPTPQAPSDAFLAEEVASYLGALNPELAEPERKRIARAVVKFSAKYDLQPSLVLAVITAESGARPWVRSPKGAVGLMQVMPHVAVSLPVAGNLAAIETNIEAGCLILSDNIRRLGEDRGILAYFWGNEIRGTAYLRQVRTAHEAILARVAIP